MAHGKSNRTTQEQTHARMPITPRDKSSPHDDLKTSKERAPPCCANDTPLPRFEIINGISDEEHQHARLLRHEARFVVRRIERRVALEQNWRRSIRRPLRRGRGGTHQESKGIISKPYCEWCMDNLYGKGVNILMM